VPDNLPRFRTRTPETHTVHRIIKAHFEKTEQIFACYARGVVRYIEIIPKLRLKNTVYTFRPLFFTKLLAVFGNFFPRRPVLTGRGRPFRSRANIFRAFIAF
jgi:hypothetical protein